MALIAKDAGRDFKPAPEGVHVAVCVDVVDKGMQDTPWGEKQKVEIRWQLEEVMEDSQPYLAVRWFTNSLNERAALRQFLETWRGKRYTEAEAKAGIDLERLEGIPAMLTIIHKERDGGGVFANVQAATALPKGVTALKPQNYIKVRNRKDEPEEEENDEPF